MNPTTTKAMKAIKLRAPVRKELAHRLISAIREDYYAFTQSPEANVEKQLGAAIYQWLLREVPARVRAMLRDRECSPYLVLTNSVQVSVNPDDLIPNAEDRQLLISRLYSAQLPGMLPVRDGRIYRNVSLSDMPDGPGRRQAIAVLRRGAERALEYQRDVARVHALLGNPGPTLGFGRPAKPQCVTLLDLYTAWPALAEEYCRRAGLTFPTDSNSAEVLADIRAGTSTSLTVATVASPSPEDLRELAYRLGLGYDDGDATTTTSAATRA